MTRTIRLLAGAAATSAALGLLAYAAIALVGMAETAMRAPVLFDLGAGALAAATALATMALAERARLARDPWWNVVALLAGVGLAPVLLSLFPATATLEAFPVLRALSAVGPVALLLAGLRAARARGDRVRAAGLALASLYVLAQLLSLGLGQNPLLSGPWGFVVGYHALALLPWLLPAAFLLVTTPARRRGRAWRIGGGATAGVAAGLGSASVLALAGAAGREVSSNALLMAFTLPPAAIAAATVAVAVGAAFAEPAPPPDAPGAPRAAEEAAGPA